MIRLNGKKREKLCKPKKVLNWAHNLNECLTTGFVIGLKEGKGNEEPGNAGTDKLSSEPCSPATQSGTVRSAIKKKDQNAQQRKFVVQ